MSLRIDTASWVGGGLQIGTYVGGGILGLDIPSGSLLAQHTDLPGDNAKEFCAKITAAPSAGTFTLYEDGSFTFTGAPAGVYTVGYDLYVDYVLLGANTASLTVGSLALAAIGGARAGGAGALKILAALAGLGGARGGGAGALDGGAVQLAAFGGPQPGGIGVFAGAPAQLVALGGARAGGVGDLGGGYVQLAAFGGARTGGAGALAAVLRLAHARVGARNVETARRPRQS